MDSALFSKVISTLSKAELEEVLQEWEKREKQEGIRNDLRSMQK